MKKNPQITDATRNKLIQAFCELYKKKPVSKITIKEITDLAGYNRCTFYQYFSDAYALLEYLEDKMIETGLQRVSTIDLKVPDFNRQFVFKLSETFREYDYFTVILLQSREGSDLFKKIKKQVMPVITKHFNISSDNETAMLALEFYLTGIFAILTHWLSDPSDKKLNELSVLVHGIWCDGLLKQLEG